MKTMTKAIYIGTTKPSKAQQSFAKNMEVAYQLVWKKTFPALIAQDNFTDAYGEEVDGYTDDLWRVALKSQKVFLERASLAVISSLVAQYECWVHHGVPPNFLNEECCAFYVWDAQTQAFLEIGHKGPWHTVKHIHTFDFKAACKNLK